jgi:hypothetical protein
MTRPIDFVTELPKGEFVSSCWCNLVSKMVIKSAAAWTRLSGILVYLVRPDNLYGVGKLTQRSTKSCFMRFN